MLAEVARAATWEITRLAGRDALRVRTREGAQTSFLTPAEKDELEALLRSGPPTIVHAGLPKLIWSAARRGFVGAAEEIGELVIEEVPQRPEAAVLSGLAADFARIRARQAEIVGAAAVRLADTARRWAEGPAPTVDEIAARLRWATLILTPTGARAWLSDGGIFAGHSIEVAFDQDGAVVDAQLAG